jgi:hypothetical protein
MSHPLRTTLVALVGIALLVPAAGAGQEPPPDELAPPPPPPTAPVDPVEPVEPAGPTSITITVPPLPAKKAAPQAKPQPAKPARREPVRRSAPRRSAPVVETRSEAREPEVPVPAATPEPKAAPKPSAKKKVLRPKPRVVAKAVAPAPARPIRDREAAGAVLGAQFALGAGSEDEGVNKTILVLALALAAVLGAVVGVVAAAPVLAGRWPSVFVPVIDATEQIVLAGICLAGAALALVITWALTGPGA